MNIYYSNDKEITEKDNITACNYFGNSIYENNHTNNNDNKELTFRIINNNINLKDTLKRDKHNNNEVLAYDDNIINDDGAKKNVTMTKLVKMSVGVQGVLLMASMEMLMMGEEKKMKRRKLNLGSPEYVKSQQKEKKYLMKKKQTKKIKEI